MNHSRRVIWNDKKIIYCIVRSVLGKIVFQKGYEFFIEVSFCFDKVAYKL